MLLIDPAPLVENISTIFSSGDSFFQPTRLR
jgi:hypothetical protein